MYFLCFLKFPSYFFVCFLSPAPSAKLCIGKYLIGQGFVRILHICGGLELPSTWAPSAACRVHLSGSCSHAGCSRDIEASFGVCLLSLQGKQVNLGLITLSMEMCDEFGLGRCNKYVVTSVCLQIAT